MAHDIENGIKLPEPSCETERASKRSQARARRRLLLSELCVDFSENTTLHGLKYVNEKSTLEKIFWLVTIAVSVACCSYLIRNVFAKWWDSPVIVAFNKEMVHVGSVPFPSITICPNWSILKEEYNYTDVAIKFSNPNSKSNMSTTKREEFEDISMICDTTYFTLDFSIRKGNATVVQNIIKYSPKLSNTVFRQRSTLKGAAAAEKYEIDAVLTELGVCFTVNTLLQDEILKNTSIQTDYKYLNSTRASRGWTMEEGYKKGLFFNETYPRRAAIFLHNPADLPHSSVHSYAALPRQLSSLALTFHSTTTSHNLRKYHPEVRQCYFQSERFLRYFHIYTQNNCMLECRANYTFHRCECVPFYLPYKNSDNVCTEYDSDCITIAIQELGEREMRASLGLEKEACRCLPACNSVTYEAEILKTEYNFKNYIKNLYKLINVTYLEGNDRDGRK
ncbi:pickpocket protein 28 [Plutella xylostella]|uniref:pickpocket protein 28 n=1 Tax=Plutella xylostella TaxID=51655 RepID=UPI0020328E7F|nr:pickpocket protein 28 [Plutella xylostella]